MVRLRKPVAHKLSQAKSGPSGPQEVRATVLGPDHFDSHGQHNGCLVHQQGGVYETAFLLQLQADSSKGQAHSGKVECDSRQTIQEQAGKSYRMAPPAGSLRPPMCQMAHSSSRSFCHKIQSQTTQVCVSSARSTGMEGTCSQPELGESGCLCVSSCVSSGQGGLQDPRSGSSQVGPHCSGVAQHALVLGSGQHVCSPFEPLQKASLKHLTFKTVFLLAVCSGKRRSEIHAWVHRNIRHQEDWLNVSLFPSPCFLSKNQLAREGPSLVAPVIIPALAPTLDKSVKDDRTLCPVRALRYYLDKTKDLRTGKQVVFVSFKKNFNKDIVPATISSWIKQTILLCYQLSNEDAQQLHQVKVHDVRAFAASKAFQGGVSLDQILSACHWKSHNTFI